MDAQKNMVSGRTFANLSDVVYLVMAFFHGTIFFSTFIFHLTLFSVLLSLYLLAYGTPMVRSFLLLYIIFARVSKQHLYSGYDIVRKNFAFCKSYGSLSTWKFVCKHYFPITLVKTAELGDEPYLIAYHPHGVIPCGGLYAIVYNGAGWNTLFPAVIKRVPHVINVFFYIPFVREYLLLNEAGSADKLCIQNTIKSGRTAVVVPGGAKEAVLIPGNNEVPLVLKTRKGFVRIAMEERVPLVPSYCFGEHNIYKIYNVGGFVQRVLRKFQAVAGFSVPLFVGSFFLLPKRSAMKVVIGAPIRTDDYEGELTEELVTKKHEEYKDALADLFEKHRDNFYPPEYKLVFV